MVTGDGGGGEEEEEQEGKAAPRAYAAGFESITVKQSNSRNRTLIPRETNPKWANSAPIP